MAPKEISALVYEEKKHLLYYALGFKDDTLLPKGISLEEDMVTVLVDHYARAGSLLKDVEIGDNGLLDWSTQVFQLLSVVRVKLQETI